MPIEETDIYNLHVINNTNELPHLCRFSASDTATGTYIRDIRSLEKDTISVAYRDYFNNQYVAFKTELAKDMINHSFPTLLEKYNIFQKFDIEDINPNITSLNKNEITLLWEYLRNAIMLERYNNQIANLEIKRQKELEYQAVLRKKRK